MDIGMTFGGKTCVYLIWYGITRNTYELYLIWTSLAREKWVVHKTLFLSASWCVKSSMKKVKFTMKNLIFPFNSEFLKATYQPALFVWLTFRHILRQVLGNFVLNNKISLQWKKWKSEIQNVRPTFPRFRPAFHRNLPQMKKKYFFN